MKIALINGSPKFKNSASGSILNALKPCIQDENIIKEFIFRKDEVSDNDLKEISEFNAIVFAFPLYVDGIPSHLLRCLYQMENYLRSNINNDIYVYAIVNLGFYEGKQANLAIEMIKNWTEKTNLKWGQGIGIGGGGMLLMLDKSTNEKGLMKNVHNTLTSLANNILSSKSSDEIYVSPSIPRIAYKIGGEMSWRQAAKENGLKTKDLFLKK